jgi:hypothetical protein
LPPPPLARPPSLLRPPPSCNLLCSQLPELERQLAEAQHTVSELLDQQEKQQTALGAAAKERAGVEARLRNTSAQLEAYKRCLAAADGWQEQLLQRSMALLAASKTFSEQHAKAAHAAQQREALAAQLARVCMEAAGHEPEEGEGAVAAQAAARATAALVDDLEGLNDALQDLQAAMDTAPPAFTTAAAAMMEDVLRDQPSPAPAAASRGGSPRTAEAAGPGGGGGSAAGMPMEALASTRRELRNSQSQVQLQQQELSVQQALRQQAEEEAAALKAALGSQKQGFAVQVGCGRGYLRGAGAGGAGGQARAAALPCVGTTPDRLSAWPPLAAQAAHQRHGGRSEAAAPGAAVGAAAKAAAGEGHAGARAPPAPPGPLPLRLPCLRQLPPARCWCSHSHPPWAALCAYGAQPAAQRLAAHQPKPGCLPPPPPPPPPLTRS